jgi:hypothetical protein
MGRKKNVHPLLRTAVDNLKSAEKEKNTKRKQLWDYRRKHKEIFKKERNISTKYWRSKTKVIRRENELAALDPMGCYIE